MQVATAAAIGWWEETRSDADEWIDAYKNSLHKPYRSALTALVQHYTPTSLMEIGCHCGPNLVRFAQDVPSLTDMLGIDASAQAIAAGQRWAQEAGLEPRVQMRVGRFPACTSGMATGCADVVVSCYALAYLSPADLDAALFEIGRLAKRAVLLAEPVTSGEPVQVQRTARGYQEWAHAYGRSLKWISSLRGMTVRMVDINPPVDYLNAILVLERA